MLEFFGIAMIVIFAMIIGFGMGRARNSQDDRDR